MENYKISKPIRLIELFAGIGSQAMALRDLGVDFTHHRVVEIDPFAIKSYNAIHGTGFEPTDITQLHGDDLGITERDQYEYIMTYSYPCQDVSVAGKQKGMEKGSDTRSSLLWEVERLLLELKDHGNLPQVLLMENVPQVIRGRNYLNFIKWYELLENLGYRSYYKLLDAKNYGIPQKRNRCFMVSVFGNYDYKFPVSIGITKCLRDVLEPIVDEKYYLPDGRVKELLQNGNIKTEDDIVNTVRVSGRGSMERHAWDLVAIKQLGNCMPTKTRKNPNQGRIYDVNGLSPCLNAMQGGGRQPFIFLKDGYRIRRLTPLECWRLMDYSDEDFCKAQAVNSNTQLYKQAGNGIVKAVLMAIFKEMLE